MMALFNKKAFDGTGKLIKSAAKASDLTFGPLVKRLTPTDEKENLDWAGDADWARLQQEPLRARSLLRLAAAVLVVLVIWAAFAKIDEVTRGEARVVPTSQVQIIQTVDGGVVEALPVKEGQVVEAGQLLLRVDSTRFVSTLMESQVSQAALQAKALRLEALTRGTPFNPPEELVKDAPDVVEQERRLYESRRAEISAQTAIYQSQLVQRQQELNEVRARRDQAERSMELMTREINATRPMVATGAVSEVEMMRLDQQMARLRGDREQATAQIARVQSAIQEANSKINEVQLTSRNQMSAELSETMSKIASLSQGGVALQDKVKQPTSSPRCAAPSSACWSTPSAPWCSPAKKWWRWCRSTTRLILEVQITPKDIGFLRPGQPAMVKFSAYDFSIYGGLEAEVFLIGADSVLDEKGNAFYHVRVRTAKSSLGPNLPIIPGMVAQVDIMTGKKTVLSYLLKPVLRAKSNAMTER